MEKVTKEVLLSYLKKLHPDASCALIYKNDYELLISIILSAQTTDAKVNEVTSILFPKYPDFLSLSRASITDIENIIHRLGLYHAKAKNIISCADKISKEYNGKAPSNYDLLSTLSGVGRKTANVFLSEYYNMNTLGVDTHIMRVTKRLQIAKDGDNSSEVEKKLKAFFKETDYRKLHHMIIAFGRNECNARKPLCASCEIKRYCKYGHDL